MPHAHKACQKKEKRCIPKEGMPHTHKVCQKKEREKYSPYQKHYKGKRINIKEFSSIIHQKYPHTCTSWSRLMTCFSFGSGLWLSEIWEASLPLYPPYLQIHQKETIRSRMEKERRIKRPWWGMNHIWAIREITRGTYIFFFKNYIKPPDWRLNKGVVSGTLQAVLTLNRQRWGRCYKPHRSKVKGANKANLFRIKVRTLGCALGISQECDIVATLDQQPKSKAFLRTNKGLASGELLMILKCQIRPSTRLNNEGKLYTLLAYLYH